MDAIGHIGGIVGAEFDHQQGFWPPLDRSHCVAQSPLAAGQFDQHPVHQFNRRWTEVAAGSECIQRGSERVELRDEKATVLGPGHQFEFCFSDHRQGALGADQEGDQGRKGEWGRGGTVVANPVPLTPHPFKDRWQVVATDPPKDFWELAVDLAGILSHRPICCAIGITLPRPRFQFPLVLKRGQATEPGSGPVGENDRKCPDVIRCLAINHGTRPRRVVTNHPTQGRTARGRHIRAESQPKPGNFPIQLIENHARLNSDSPPGHIHFTNVSQILGAIEYDPRADCLSRQTRSPPTGCDRDSQFCRDLDGHLEIVGGFGEDHSKGLNLVVAGIGGVEPPGRVVESHLTGKVPAKVANQGIPACRVEIHAVGDVEDGVSGVRGVPAGAICSGHWRTGDVSRRVS